MRRALLPVVALLIACTPPPEPRPAPPLPEPKPLASASASAEPPRPAFKPMLARVPVDAQDIAWGDPQAPVTAVLFGELSTGDSERMLKQLSGIQASMGEKTLRIVWKSFARQAIPFEQKLAQMTVGVAQVESAAAARKFIEAILADPSARGDAKAAFEKAREAGVKDTEAFGKRTIADEFLPRVQEDLTLGVKLNVEQGPTVFINGYLIAGRAKESALRDVINDERVKVEELLKTGKKMDEVYALRTQHNSTNEQKFPWSRPPLAAGQFYRVPVGNSPAAGPAAAPVTMVIFGGYQDPFSTRLMRTVKALQKRYKKELKVVWKEAPLPFHKYSIHLAALGREARDQGGDALFWRAMEKLGDYGAIRQKHQKLDNPEQPGPLLDALGREVGLKKKGSEAARLDKHLKAIEGDRELTRAMNVQGTPGSFVNGEYVSGAQAEEVIEAAIKRALERARAKEKEGVAPDKVYEAIMKDIKEAEE